MQGLENDTIELWCILHFGILGVCVFDYISNNVFW